MMNRPLIASIIIHGVMVSLILALGWHHVTPPRATVTLTLLSAHHVPSSLPSSPKITPTMPQMSMPSPPTQQQVTQSLLATEHTTPNVSTPAYTPSTPVSVSATTPTLTRSAPPPPSISVEDVHQAKESYNAYLFRTIQSNKVYPENARRLRQMGTVWVACTIAPDGTIRDIRIKTSSGFGRLDQAAMVILQTIGSFKPLPKEINHEPLDVLFPIEYSLK